MKEQTLKITFHWDITPFNRCNHITSVAAVTICKGEQGTAELGANSVVKQTN